MAYGEKDGLLEEFVEAFNRLEGDYQGNSINLTHKDWGCAFDCNIGTEDGYGQFHYTEFLEQMFLALVNCRYAKEHDAEVKRQGYLEALGDVEHVIKMWQFKYDGQFYAVSRDILLEHIEKSRAGKEEPK